MQGERRFLGRSVPRVEDAPLLVGGGAYTGDLAPPGLAHLVVVRSDHPSADLRAIDLRAAARAPGVLGAWTGDDLAADGVGAIPWEDWPAATTTHATRPRAGDPAIAAPQPVLARGRVRYQGEPLVMVVAGTLEQARDAAEQVAVDYVPRPSVSDASAARVAGAPAVWPHARDNRCFEIGCGDAAAADAAFARAARVVRLHLEVPRLVQNPIEPRVYLGQFAEGRYLLHAAAGKPQAVARTLAREIFRVPRDAVRVVTRDVGGGFGAKNVLYPEQALVLWAARRLGRPVRWQCSRTEAFLSDVQGRDTTAAVELALDGGGRILALRARAKTNLGAYLGPKAAIPPIMVSKILTGVYDIPIVDVRVEGVYTNTPPTGPYRGAGTPEAMFVLERVMDAAARATGVDAGAFRRRHLVPSAAMPYTSALGVTFDSGDFSGAMDAAERAADVAGFASRREASARRGRLRGLGRANMIEWAGIGPPERADVACTSDGNLRLRIGTMSNGQSHRTVYAQMLADALGIDMARVEVVQGDCDEIPDGLGTGASRSVTVAGSALLAAAARLVEAGLGPAAEMLEADAGDVVYRDGAYRVAGTDRAVALEAVAARAAAAGADPRQALAAEGVFAPADSTCPNGCHVAEVEVDPETGEVEVLAYTIAQDVGVALNPMVVEAQLAGGVTQGIGEALMERVVYDPASGQLLAGSLMDYAMPRAEHVPAFRTVLLEVPCTHTPLGAKSCGEIGATGGPVTTINAVVDALAPLGVVDLPMPATPATIRRAIEAARAGAASR